MYCACLSGHWVATAVFALITIHRTSNDDRRKLQIEDISSFTDICPTNSIQVWNLHGFLYRFWLCPSNHILKINEENCCWYWDPFKDRKPLRTKQTQVKPNANRGCPIKLANHIQPQLRKLCPKSSWTPTSQNADRAPPYWGLQRYVCASGLISLNTHSHWTKPSQWKGKIACC